MHLLYTYLRAEQRWRRPHRGGRVQRDAGAVDGDPRQRLHAVPRGGGEQEQAAGQTRRGVPHGWSCVLT
jgi:hypothetical protein